MALPTPNSTMEKLLSALYKRMNGEPYAIPTTHTASEKILEEIIKGNFPGGTGGGDTDDGGDVVTPPSSGGGSIPADLEARIAEIERYMREVFNPIYDYGETTIVDFTTFRNSTYYTIIDDTYPWVHNMDLGEPTLVTSNNGKNSTTSSTTIRFGLTRVKNQISYDTFGSSESADKLTVTLVNLTTNITYSTLTASGTTLSSTWKNTTVEIPAGLYELRLSYKKDSSVHTSLDKYYIRNLMITGERSVINE